MTMERVFVLTHRKQGIHQLPVSRGTRETEQKSGHTEILIVFSRFEILESACILACKVEQLDLLYQ